MKAGKETGQADEGHHFRKPVSLLSYVTISWLTPILKKAKTGPLTLDDVYKVSEKESAEHLSKQSQSFQNQVAEYIASGRTLPKPSLKGYLYKFYRNKIAITLLLGFVDAVSSVAIPLLMRQLLLVVEDVKGEYSSRAGLIYAAGLAGSLLSRSISFTLYLLLSNRIEYSIKSQLTDMMMAKQFKLSSKSKSIYSNSDIINLIQTELGFAISFWTMFSTFPGKLLQILAQCFFLYELLGLPFLASVGAILFVTGIAIGIASCLDYWVRGMRSTTNSRVSLVRELVQGARTIKLQASEDVFKDRILKEHYLYVDFLTPYFWVFAVADGFRIAATPIISVISFVGYSLFGGSLKAAIIFPAVALFDVSSPVAHLTDHIKFYTQAQKPLAQIEDFLLADEAIGFSNTLMDSDDAIVIKNLCVGYETDAAPSFETSTFSLQVDGLILQKEGFYGIYGSVGSGKSTFLKTLLRELTPFRGTATVNGRLAYCAQEPWIMQGSIEDNIVFGSEFDVERLTLAVESCGMQQDLLSFPDGIKSMIGENGVNLSGGQKSRIALARAVYSDADVFLLDNPLASCDAKVSKRIFTRLRDVLKTKTVLMVSNSASLLARMDQLIEFEDGRVKFFGPASDSEMNMLDLEKEGVESDSDAATEVERDSVKQVKAVDEFVAKEDKEEGRVKKELYLELIAKAGPWNVFLMVLCCIISFVFSVANPLWLKEWSLNTDESKNVTFLVVFAVLGMMDTITTVMVTLGGSLLGLLLGKDYHYEALDGLLKASMTFFDTNPTGRILNRFNGDVVQTERGFSVIFGLSFSALMRVLAAVLIICLLSPYMVALVVISVLLTIPLVSLYSPGMVEGNRLVPIASSSVFSLLNDTLEGSSTIKAFQKLTLFSGASHRKLDSAYGALYACQGMTYWLDLRVVAASSLLALVVGIFSCLIPKTPESAATLGLALLSAISLSTSLATFVYQFAILESRLNSIERLRHYGKKIPYEKVEGSLKIPQDQKWPARGEIEMSNLKVAYDQRPDHLVIRNLSLTIKGGEKIGICGRTGCGKSTLVACLFRLLELRSGYIKIDGVNISLLNLKILRQGMQIIPQDPILFTGTVRTNLVASEETVTDTNVWEALERVGLKEYVSCLAEKLDAPIDASGSNMSFGQRQLMCLARAFLAKPVILVMDEATASIDQESDARVQSIIKQHFSQATIISIAHRLESIADFDKILVLDAGELVEFDAPSVLLSDPTSAFSQLVEAAGPETREKIRSISVLQ